MNATRSAQAIRVVAESAFGLASSEDKADKDAEAGNLKEVVDAGGRGQPMPQPTQNEMTLGNRSGTGRRPIYEIIQNKTGTERIFSRALAELLPIP